MLGSILSNILLVLGCSFLAGWEMCHLLLYYSLVNLYRWSEVQGEQFPSDSRASVSCYVYPLCGLSDMYVRRSASVRSGTPDLVLLY
jgi:hypothetical protein